MFYQLGTGKKELSNGKKPPRLANRQACEGILFISICYGRALPTVGCGATAFRAGGPGCSERVGTAAMGAHQQAAPLHGLCDSSHLEFLLGLPWMVNYRPKDEMNPFLPKLLLAWCFYQDNRNPKTPSL